jgi:hypothetical protein
MGKVKDLDTKEGRMDALLNDAVSMDEIDYLISQVKSDADELVKMTNELLESVERFMGSEVEKHAQWSKDSAKPD